MSQSIPSLSTALSACQTSETVSAAGGGCFTLSKSVEVLSSRGAESSTDQVDRSPDARKALQAFLSGTVDGTGNDAFSGSGEADADDGIGISVASATVRTVGRQFDQASVSDDEISRAAADGRSGEIEVTDGVSLATNLRLVPLGPRLQAASAPAGVAVAEIITGADTGGTSVPSTVGEADAASRPADAGEAALLLLEAGRSFRASTSRNA